MIGSYSFEGFERSEVAVTDTGRAALATQLTLAERLEAFRVQVEDFRKRLPIYHARGEQQLVDDMVGEFAAELADLKRMLAEAIRAGQVAE